MFVKRKAHVISCAAVLLAVFAITTIGCPTGGGGGGGDGRPTELEGTWNSGGGNEITFSGGTFTRIEESSSLDFRGNFNISDDTITFTINRYSQDGGATWLTYQQYIDAMIIAYMYGMTEAEWNALTNLEKQHYRDIYLNFINIPITSFTWTFVLEGDQLITTYSDGGTEVVVLYQKSGTSAVSAELLGQWAYVGEPRNVVIEFTVNQLKWSGQTYYTLETEGKIEIGSSPGIFDLVFCDSYTLEGGELSFSGGTGAAVTSVEPLVKYVFPPFPATPLVVNEWMDGEITSGSEGEVWYSFAIISGTTYYIWWNGSSYGDTTKTLDAYASAFYSNQTQIFANNNSGWNSPQSFTASLSGTAYVRISSSSWSSSRTGNYGIVYSTDSARPVGTFDPPSNHTLLNADQWANGEITGSSDGEDWYSFPVASGITYRIWWNDSYNGNYTKSLDVMVSAWLGDGTSVFSGVDSRWSSAQSFTPASNGTIYVRVYPKYLGYVGTYGIVYSLGNSIPAVAFDSPASLTQLAADTWEHGEITTASNGEEWYSFDVTAGTTYRIWWNCSNDGNGLKTLSARVSAWYDDGVSIFNNSSYGWYAPQTVSPGTSGTVYIRVTPSTTSDVGTFGIVYGTDSARPDGALDLPAGLTQLTADTWEHGEITTASNGEEWYSFDVTAGTTYRFWWNGSNDGNGLKTLRTRVSAWHSDGTRIINLFSNGWNSSQTVSPDTSGTVYIRVTPGTESDVGTFGIVYSTGSTRPGGALDLPAGLTQLTTDTWEHGEITAASNGEEWYSFDVTAGTTYRIWWNEIQGDGLKTLNTRVSAWFDDGVRIFNNISYGWYAPQTVSPGTSGTVYIRVTPGTESDIGTFGIVYSTGSTRPTGAFGVSSSILLEDGVWRNDSIDIDIARIDVWYSISVTAGDVYRIWWNDSVQGSGKTLDIEVSGYYSNGNVIFPYTNSGWDTPQNFSPISSETVYIRVRRNSSFSTDTGTYGIVYTENDATRPSI